MNRTATLAASGGVAVAIVVGTLAIAANVGVLSSAEAGVGALEDGTVQPITVTLDPAPSDTASAEATQPPGVEGVAPVPAPVQSAVPPVAPAAVDDDDSDDRDDHSGSSSDDDDDDDSGPGRSDDDEYEGADDDD